MPTFNEIISDIYGGFKEVAGDVYGVALERIAQQGEVNGTSAQLLAQIEILKAKQVQPITQQQQTARVEEATNIGFGKETLIMMGLMVTGIAVLLLKK